MLNSGSTNNRQWFHNWQINQHNHHKTPTHLKHHTTMHIVYQINQYYAMWLNNDTMHVVPFIFAMPNKATTNFANVGSSQQQFIFANYAMHVTHLFNNIIYMQLPYIGIQHKSIKTINIIQQHNQSSRTVLCIAFASTKYFALSYI